MTGFPPTYDNAKAIVCATRTFPQPDRELDYVYKPGLGDNPLGNLSGRTKPAVVASCKEQGESIKRDL